MAGGDYWDGFDDGVDAAIVRRPHARVIEQVARQVQRWFRGGDVHVEQRRRERGRPGRLARWPDIQFVHPVRRRATHIEVDTTQAGMNRHVRDHLAHSRQRRGVFLRIDPASGAIVRKLVFAAGASRPMRDQRGTRQMPLRLDKDDVFDAWDD